MDLILKNYKTGMEFGERPKLNQEKNKKKRYRTWQATQGKYIEMVLMTGLKIMITSKWNSKKMFYSKMSLGIQSDEKTLFYVQNHKRLPWKLYQVVFIYDSSKIQQGTVWKTWRWRMEEANGFEDSDGSGVSGITIR